MRGGPYGVGVGEREEVGDGVVGGGDVVELVRELGALALADRLPELAEAGELAVEDLGGRTDGRGDGPGREQLFAFDELCGCLDEVVDDAGV